MKCFAKLSPCFSRSSSVFLGSSFFLDKLDSYSLVCLLSLVFSEFSSFLLSCACGSISCYNSFLSFSFNVICYLISYSSGPSSLSFSNASIMSGSNPFALQAARFLSLSATLVAFSFSSFYYSFTLPSASTFAF